MMKRKWSRGLCLFCLIACVVSLLMPAAYATNLSDEYLEFLPFDGDEVTSAELADYLRKQANAQVFNPGIAMDSEWIYFYANGNGDNGIWKEPLDGSALSEFQLGNPGDAVVLPLFTQEGYLYYYLYFKSNGFSQLCRGKTDGSSVECIATNVFSNGIQLDGQYIYYTTEKQKDANGTNLDGSCNLYRCDLEGNNTQLILGKPVFCFAVFGDKVMYQDDRDNESLHIYNMQTGNDLKINDISTDDPVFDGNIVSFLSTDHKTIHKTSLDGSFTEEIALPFAIGRLSMHGDYYYFTNKDDANRLYRCATDGSGITCVVDEENIQYTWFGDQIGFLSDASFTLCDGEGSNRLILCEV